MDKLRSYLLVQENSPWNRVLGRSKVSSRVSMVSQWAGEWQESTESIWLWDRQKLVIGCELSTPWGWFSNGYGSDFRQGNRRQIKILSGHNELAENDCHSWPLNTQHNELMLNRCESASLCSLHGNTGLHLDIQLLRSNRVRVGLHFRYMLKYRD